ncbi:unnamed protein product [Linum tenue]|uniref:AIG1-type G domain-containing protein n=1 Tax=Linum tenue TaxID=586396 RepID=A0AAV0NNZ3_9ROSI|nr:unnamed protein product [Linum tenue]
MASNATASAPESPPPPSLGNSSVGDDVRNLVGTDDGGFVSGEEEFEAASEQTLADDIDDNTLGLDKAGSLEVSPSVVEGAKVIGREAPLAAATPVPPLDAVEVDGEAAVALGAEESGKIESAGVNLSSEGDSVIETVRVDLPAPGVAVVGDVEGSSYAETEVKEEVVAVSESVPLDNEFDKIAGDGEEPAQLVDVMEPGAGKAVSSVGDEKLDAVTATSEPATNKLAEEAGVKFTSEGDSVVEAVRVDIDLPVSGVAVVGDVDGNAGSGTKAAPEEVAVVNESVPLDNIFEKIAGDEEGLIQLDNHEEPGSGFEADAVEMKQIGGEVDVSGLDKDGSLDKGGVAEAAVLNGNQEISAREASFEGVVMDDGVNGRTDQTDGDTIGQTLDLDEDQTLGSAVREILASETTVDHTSQADEHLEHGRASDQRDRDEPNVTSDKSGFSQSFELDNITSAELKLEDNDEVEDEGNDQPYEDGDDEGSDGETEGVIFGSSEAAKQFLEDLKQGTGAGSGANQSKMRDGAIVTDSDEEVETDEDEGDGKEMYDSAALAALLKAVSGAGSEGDSVTVTSQDGSRLFSVERPAGLGSSLRSVKPSAQRPLNRPNLFAPSTLASRAESDDRLSEDEKKKLEKLQQIMVKYLRLVFRLGYSPDESIVGQVLYRLAIVAGKPNSQLFNVDAAKRSALQLEADGKEEESFSLNILVLGKSGVGKSATINAILGEEKSVIHAFEPATRAVKVINGVVNGVKISVIDSPGLKSSGSEQGTNRRTLSAIKSCTRKCPPDIVLYVDRLDTQIRDLNDLPLLRSITNHLGSSIWRNAIVTLTHAASAPPDGPSGAPLSYDVFVAQRSHVVQQSIGQAVGDLRLMNPSLMNPVSLVENHPSCRKNRDGEKVLPNGQSWRPQLLLLCFSMKILSEATSMSKPQEQPLDPRKLLGLRVRSPPLPYLLSWLLQSRPHPKLSTDQGVGESIDSDVDLAEFSDSDQEDDDEYEQLPPFKPLRKSQLSKLSKEQKRAYLEEYDYRVKLLQKKQWKEELRRLKEMKKRGKRSAGDDYGYDMGEDGADADEENGGSAAVQVPLPDMVLPPSFDGDSPAYRYRFLEPTNQLLARPVLDTHGWDHDCGYDGVNVEHSLAVQNRFPAAVTVQVTKDKKEFNLHLDSSVAVKHGENGSSMAGFDIQNVGKQLAYIVRGETKFKNYKKNKTVAGASMTFLGPNVATGIKLEDQIVLGKRLMLVGSTGTVRSQGDSAYGANMEVRLREADFPIGQDQSSLGLSLVKWRGDLAVAANLQSQFSVGRSSKIAVRAGLNNKLSGQISVRTSSSDQLQIAMVGLLPIALAIYKSIRPGVAESYSMY